MLKMSIVRVVVASLLASGAVACKKKDDNAAPKPTTAGAVDAGGIFVAAPRPADASPMSAPPPVTDAATAAVTPAAEGTPEKAIADFQKAVATGDDKAIWAFVSNKSKKWMTTGEVAQQMAQIKDVPDEALAELAGATGKTPAELKKLEGAELARVLIVAETKKNKDEIVGSKFLHADVKGDRAVCLLSKPTGGEKVLVLIREEGTWRMDGEETGKLEAGPGAPDPE